MEIFLLGIAAGLLGYFFGFCPLKNYWDNSKVFEHKINAKTIEGSFTKLTMEDIEVVKAMKILLPMMKQIEELNVHKYHKEKLISEIRCQSSCISRDLSDRVGKEYIQYLMKEIE